MTLVLRYTARSDRGLARSNNQDSVYAGPRLLAVADGMGGHAAGEVASKVVIAALAPLDDDEPSEDLLRQLHEATLAGNSAIAELVANEPDLDGMGTTLSAILFAGSRIGLVHVGDSRIYLRRGGAFAQITHDDTFVQSLIDEGRITEEEAATHPQRSLLLKALTGHEVDPSLTVREARAGDRYLICSDGLSGFVSHETLAETLQIPDAQACADRMIELALKAGGLDNVTVIVADVVDVDYGENAPIVGGAAGNGSDQSAPPDSPAVRAGAFGAAAKPISPPRRIESLEPPPPDPKVKRRKRIRLVLGGVVLLALIAAGVIAAIVWVNRQYFVGESDDGELAIFQGVSGSVLGLSLNSRVQGSCVSNDLGCERFYVDDLDAVGRDLVRSGSGSSFEDVAEARRFLDDLRQDYGMPVCDEASTTPNEPDATTTPTISATPSTPILTSSPPTPGGVIPPETTTSSTPSRPSQIPGVNCRTPGRDGGEGGG